MKLVLFNGDMLGDDALRTVPVLEGALVRLVPLTESVFDDYWTGMHDPEVDRLTGTHATFEPDTVRQWLRTREEQPDRSDWAILRAADDQFLGEAVINDFDPENESASYRLWLAGPTLFGRGYGTEATRLVVDHALERVGLHRLSLEVFDHNPRARHVYEKCGFMLEGRLRSGLLWEGRRHDILTMAVLRTDPRPTATAS